jgi:hypothetical protein
MSLYKFIDLYVNVQFFVLQCCIKVMNFAINFVDNFYFYPCIIETSWMQISLIIHSMSYLLHYYITAHLYLLLFVI